MPAFHRLEIAINMWEITLFRLSEEEVRAKLNSLRWKAMRILAQMSPMIEVFYQACVKNTAWCLPNTLPPLRLAAGQLPPKENTSMRLINNCLSHMAQLVHDLGGETIGWSLRIGPSGNSPWTTTWMSEPYNIERSPGSTPFKPWRTRCVTCTLP